MLRGAVTAKVLQLRGSPPAAAAPHAAVDRPTVLLVGDGDPMDAALRAALERHDAVVEAVSVAKAVEACVAVAPDLVLLVGDAAAEGGVRTLALLATHPATSVVPCALVSDEELEDRIRAFRHGAVAVVRRSASADEMARAVFDLAREMPDRPGEASGALGEATLEELLSIVQKELRAGILSVESEKEGGPVRLVLGPGRPVADLLREFVDKLRPMIAKAEPLRYEIIE